MADDPIVSLAAKLETLIAKTVSIESLDNKLTELVEKIAAMTVTLDTMHGLVNSHTDALIAALEKAAAIAELLAGKEGEERGAERERNKIKESSSTL
jgi:hypothetical protein